MNKGKTGFHAALRFIVIVVAVLYFYHPMVKDKARALNMVDTCRINGFLLVQDKELNLSASQEHKFRVALYVEKYENCDIDVAEVLEKFSQKYFEEYFAVLVLFEEDDKYVYAKYLTKFDVQLSSQMTDEQILQSKSYILDYFNNNKEREGMEYFYNLMYYCAQTGHWVNGTNSMSNGVEGYADQDNNLEDATGYYYDDSENDNYAEYYEIYGFGEGDVQEEEDKFAIFDRSDEETPYDRGREEGYAADAPYENFHGYEEDYSDEYMDGYADGRWDSYVEEHTYEQDLDSYGEFFDDHYGDFMDDNYGYDYYEDYDYYGDYDYGY